MFMIGKLKELVDFKKSVLEKKYDLDDKTKEVELQKLNYLRIFLNNDMCFFDIDYDTAYNILVFLGISEDDVLNVYRQLISPQNINKSDFILIDNENNIKN